jgi:hypothetical protein
MNKGSSGICDRSVKSYVMGFGRLLLLKSCGVDEVTQLSRLFLYARQ